MTRHGLRLNCNGDETSSPIHFEENRFMATRTRWQVHGSRKSSMPRKRGIPCKTFLPTGTRRQTISVLHGLCDEFGDWLAPGILTVDCLIQ